MYFDINKLLINVLLIIFAFLAATKIVDYYREYKVDKLFNEPVVSSIEDLKILKDYKNKPQPEQVLSGEYSLNFHIDDVAILSKHYFSEGNKVNVEVLIKSGGLDLKYQGSAKYSFDGSVIIFEEVHGARGLFPDDAGIAIEIVDENTYFLIDADERNRYVKVK